MQIKPEWIEAVDAAFFETFRATGGRYRESFRAALSAVAPLIAAEERERVAQLCDRLAIAKMDGIDIPDRNDNFMRSAELRIEARTARRLAEVARAGLRARGESHD